MISIQEKHLQVLDHLNEKYKFSEKEMELLGKIRRNTIHSVSFTTDGGFDSETGEFYPEENKSTYKIKIKYEEKGSNNLQMVYLMPSIGSIF